MWAWLTGFFSTSGVMKTADDALRKLGGLDELNSKERVDAFVTVLKETKHQSPARRFIATLVTAVWATLVLSWLLFTSFGNPSIALEIQEFMVATIREPFNYIIGFYFVSQILSGVKR